MKSTRVSLRLMAEEVAMLDKLRLSETGSRNRSEYFRFLMHRDWNRRRHRTSVVQESLVSSDERIGRPRRTGQKCEAADGIEIGTPVEVA
jgi:hypothetical protein